MFLSLNILDAHFIDPLPKVITKQVVVKLTRLSCIFLEVHICCRKNCAFDVRLSQYATIYIEYTLWWTKRYVVYDGSSHQPNKPTMVTLASCGVQFAGAATPFINDNIFIYTCRRRSTWMKGLCQAYKHTANKTQFTCDSHARKAAATNKLLKWFWWQHDKLKSSLELLCVRICARLVYASLRYMV